MGAETGAVFGEVKNLHLLIGSKWVKNGRRSWGIVGGSEEVVAGPGKNGVTLLIITDSLELFWTALSSI